MLPTINIGPLVLPTAAFIYILGAWLCITLGEKAAHRLNLDPQTIANLVTIGLVAGVIGARLTFVALYWSAYQDNLLGIIWPINAGFNPLGGMLFGALGMLFYGRYKQLPLAQTLDALAPVIITSLMIISLAEFFGGPGFGTPTSLPWGLSNFGISRHPVQIYEIIIGLVALLVWRALIKRRVFNGQLFLLTTAVYALGRLFVDAFRADAWLSPGGWHMLQLLSLLVTLACLILLFWFTPLAEPERD